MDTRPHVLIADHDDHRARTIEGVLRREYEVHVDRAKTWTEVIYKDRDYDNRPPTFYLVILAEDLLDTQTEPPFNDRVRNLLLNQYRMSVRHVIGLAFNASAAFSDFEQASRVVWSKAENIGQLREALDACRLPRFRPGPELSYSEAADPLLKDQVVSLDRDGSPDEAEIHLRRMLLALWDDCERVELHPLPQGLSGARVLLAQPSLRNSGRSSDRFVIKIASQADYWKLKNGVEHFDRITEALEPTPYQGHLPLLVRPARSSDECMNLVSSGKWFAVAYHFLGHELGEFMNLDRAYKSHCAPPTNLSAGFCSAGSLLAESLLLRLLDHLTQAWYKDVKCDNKEIPLWTTRAAPTQQVLSPPPYQFTVGQRGRVLDYLEELDDLGSRLLGQQWHQDAIAVRGWMRQGPPKGSLLDKPRNAVVSAVHGDLNRFNVFLWVEKGQVFLIDFDMYQAKGHTMQDFAQIEAEVKFGLMDRETCGPDALPALDLTPGRLGIWCKLEDSLSSCDWPSELSHPAAILVLRAGNLVRTIRSHAARVHQSASGPEAPESFVIEYGAALLFHTLRTIGYRGTSPLKRILAIHSAARIINLLQTGPVSE